MILNKDVLVGNINRELADNINGQISPYDIRHNLLDTIDSIHLLTKGKNIDSANFATPATRNVKAGENALFKLDLEGHYSSDNVAIGFEALKNSYQTNQNIAIGSHALNCSVFGDDNIAIGYNASSKNTIGFGNISIGSFSLANNKSGNFNLAIGHGAGYYIDPKKDYQFYIASFAVDGDYICDNPTGSGHIPLLHGDLNKIILGVGVSGIRNDSTLQVGGHATPEQTNSYNLGLPNYSWRNLYLSSGINFGDNIYFGRGSGLNIYSSGNILPGNSNQYSLGSTLYPWGDGVFKDINVLGKATFNRYVAYHTCDYLCKVVNLASPSGELVLDGGGPNSIYDYSNQNDSNFSDCAYPDDNAVDGAGFNIISSGSSPSYFRQYNFTFRKQDPNLECLELDNAFSRSSWNSNISINIASGCHLQTDRILFPNNISLVSTNDCSGIFLSNGNLFVTNETLLGEINANRLLGTGKINFIAPSGNNDDFVVNLMSPNPNQIIKQRFITNARGITTDSYNNKNIFRGFELSYIDDNNTIGGSINRFVIGSYDNTSEVKNSLVIMQSEAEGIVGITNLYPYSDNILPATSLNVRSFANSIGRFTSENNTDGYKAAIQLVGADNCITSSSSNSLELSFINSEKVGRINMYFGGTYKEFVRFNEFNQVGFFVGEKESNQTNSAITIGSSGHPNVGLSLFSRNNDEISASGYGKIYVKQYPVFQTNLDESSTQLIQQDTIYLLDSSGIKHNLVVNKYDVKDGRGLYTDNNGNTFGGLDCPANRSFFSASLVNNTALGNQALLNAYASSGNTIVGSKSANNISNGSGNVVLGFNSFNNTNEYSSHNIIIGNNLLGNSIDSYNYLVGYDGNIILLSGVLGPDDEDKSLSIPNSGKFTVYGPSNTYGTSINFNKIEFIDNGGDDYPDSSMYFDFVGNSGASLLELNHSAYPMSGTFSYEEPEIDRPYIELMGDLKLRGSIRFSDNTSLDTSSGIRQLKEDLITSSGITTFVSGITEFVSGLIPKPTIEGYAKYQINPPSNPANPTSGIITTKNQNWENVEDIFVINRDTTSVVHSGAYVIAVYVNNEYRPMWISLKDNNTCCYG